MKIAVINEAKRLRFTEVEVSNSVSAVWLCRFAGCIEFILSSSLDEIFIDDPFGVFEAYGDDINFDYTSILIYCPAFGIDQRCLYDYDSRIKHLLNKIES